MLVALQSRRNLGVPVFLIDVGRFFVQCAAVPGLLEPLSSASNTSLKKLKADVCIGYEFDIDKATHPSLIFWSVCDVPT